MRFLLVDDNFISRRVNQAVFEYWGVCEQSSGGAEAIEMIKDAKASGTMYNLVCLDLMMPGMDGHETMTHIRDWETSQGVSADEFVKIIIITSLEDKKNVIQAFKGGCDLYMTKPITKEKVMDSLVKLKLITPT